MHYSLLHKYIAIFMKELTKEQIEQRLADIQREIEAERVSYGELAELYELRDHIPEDNVVLREWADIPEDAVKCAVCGCFLSEDDECYEDETTGEPLCTKDSVYNEATGKYKKI